LTYPEEGTPQGGVLQFGHLQRLLTALDRLQAV
jgi:hypothetical protein